MSVWTGKNGSGVWSDPGADPTVAYGPVPASGVTSNGIPLPPFKPGMVVTGDLGTEFILCKLVLAAATDLIPGQAYQWDKDYLATILTTAASVLNEEVGFAQIYANQLAAGTYYVWLGRSGHLPVVCATGTVATGSGETTATAGALKFPASPTAGSKSVSPTSAYVASAGFTFTANTVNGSPTLTNLSSVTDLCLGALISGTGIPANANIQAIRAVGGGKYAIDIGTSTSGALSTLQNATATGTAVTITVTGTLPVNVDWPTLNKQN
jgi:hypothetical protein